MASIYGAVTDHELWPAALAGLQSAFDGSAAALMSYPGDLAESRIISTRPAPVDDYLRHWVGRNPLRRHARSLTAGTVATDWMLLEKPDLTSSAYFNEFLLPNDIPHLMAIKLAAGPHIDIALNLMRGCGQSAFDTTHLTLARRLGPHLQAAVRMAGQLAWAGLTGEGTPDRLDRSGRAAILLDRHGTVLHLNTAAAGMLTVPDGLRVLRGRLIPAVPAEQAALAKLLGRATIGDSDGRRGGGAMIVSRPSGLRPWALITAPVETDLDWLLPQHPAAIVMITDTERTPMAGAARLSDLYGFTARESAVARGIATGTELKDVADSLGLTILSARQYLSRALQKSGARRQHDLVRLLVTLGVGPA